MYNRYIPGADGTFQRMTVASSSPASGGGEVQRPVPTEFTVPICEDKRNTEPESGHFLKKLFPAGCELGDLLLLAVLLLLLVDGEEDNTLSILLTAAAFFLL